ncbi:exodeoxyribonuclease V subunit beta [Alteromonas pelagimontana]|uniref:RecBCD enzyme subunit RecB n=1 Tax=Alteromonas pelagimontana TaxID=1858656 RepID=A0A6M4MH74_9ALTE|nr:exodeoxyribonuclease V subunit beta [Alteromonas pelagimontana]QJR82337.1 exodeoxyribonuclease V subunit beta [Alteromonas pelagimontana]
MAKPLDVVGMPLAGRHLIEASAGTGKTFNITRLYLRLLLEKNLSVQQILVMTFTNAATEEIRGRIAATLREALLFWLLVGQKGIEAAPDADPVYRHLYQQYPETGRRTLEAALLELDEASVFTIHGFCNKVLSQLAFSGGTPMELSLATDTRMLYVEASRDWVRMIAGNAEHYPLLVQNNWHDPETLLAQFGAAIRSGLVPNVLTKAQIEEDFATGLQQEEQTLETEFVRIREGLLNEEHAIASTLIEGKKDAAVRQEEWSETLAWLQQAALTAPPAAIGKFINGNRYRGNEHLKTVFAPLKEFLAHVKKTLVALESDRDKRVEAADSYALVAQAFEFIRQHVATQKRRLGIVDFDDLIRLLAEQVSDRNNGLQAELRSLFPVALIDEFQDTDANQYQILATVYPPGSTDNVLMMIGDPKQAIYGFRGGDIFTYLEAGRQADHRWVMNTNWRSVEKMVTAYNRLFYGNLLTEDAANVFGYGIDYEPVNSTAGAKAAATPLNDPNPHRAALNYVLLQPNDENDAPAKTQMQHQLALWMCTEISRLLDEARLGDRAVEPADIAILVRSTPEAVIVQQALKRAGLGAVFLSNRVSLFASAQAQDLYRVLDGIWHWENKSRLAAALSSPLLGLSHQNLIDLLYHEDDKQWEAVMSQVLLLRDMWQKRGCMAVILHLLQTQFCGLDESTERTLTNYVHLAEVVERAATTQPQPEQLLIWLHRQVSAPEQADEQVQRLESDARLIQLVTQHGSKGLEYPIVFVPFASVYRDPAKAGNQWIQQFRFYDSEQKQLALQLGRSYRAVEKVRQEGHAEATRLLYVAVTRAAHRCYLGIAPFNDSEQSPLAQALGVKDKQNWQQILTSLQNEPGDHTALVEVQHPFEHRARAPKTASEEALSLATFCGSVEENWRLYSFSALARQQAVVKHTRRESEPVAAVAPETIQAASPESAAFRFQFEKGAGAGNLLHDLLEVVNFNSADWASSASEVISRFHLAADKHDALFNWLNEVLAMPLHLPHSSPVCLKDLAETSILREAKFYFPVKNARWQGISQVLMAHRQSFSQEQLLSPPSLDRQSLEGMMHGFIDLIFEHEGKFFVADYKSTYLGDRIEDYHFAALLQNNQQHLYDVQYLIYCLALHRYLQKMIPDYDADVHFGGVFYLYLRGMHAENTRQEGVFYTPVTASLLNDLDTLFGGTAEVPETEQTS